MAKTGRPEGPRGNGKSEQAAQQGARGGGAATKTRRNFDRTMENVLLCNRLENGDCSPALLVRDTRISQDSRTVYG